MGVGFNILIFKDLYKLLLGLGLMISTVHTAGDPVATYVHLINRVQREYVEPVSDEKLLEGSLQGMLNALDPHSTYFTPEKFKDIQRQVGGTYGGLGLEIIIDKGGVQIISTIDDSPAFRAGLQTGDLIMAIDSEPTYGIDPHTAGEKLRGEPGTKIDILVKRQLDSPFKVSLTRELIQYHPVKSKVIKINNTHSIGYIRLSTFSHLTTKELEQAVLKAMTLEKNNLKGFIFDVRNNAGGLLDQAISVSNLFMKKGLIVSIKGRNPKDNAIYEAKGDDILKGLPIVIMINAGSASAAEIFAGALQDNNRALVVGSRSFGKGSVQTVFPLPSGGAVKFTTAYYYTPSGKSIQKKGIVPDIEIKQLIDIKAIDDTAYYREGHMETGLNHGLKGENKNETIEDKNVKDNTKSVIPMNPFIPVADYQLDQAITIIQAIDLKNKLSVLKSPL